MHERRRSAGSGRSPVAKVGVRRSAVRRAGRRDWLGIALVVVLALGCESATEGSHSPSEETRTDAPSSRAAASSAGPESSWQSPSAAGHFRITIRPEDGQTPIGPLHAWIVAVESSEGRPAEIRQLAFDGGMPAHGHGFETKPQVTDRLAPGVYRVDGIRFHMAGGWRVRVDVAGDAAADTAFFDIEVEP